jgi:hypothetical protein
VSSPIEGGSNDTSFGRLEDREGAHGPGGYLTIELRDGTAPSSARLRVLDEAGRDVGDLHATELEDAWAEERMPSVRRFGPLPPGNYRAVAVREDGRVVERAVDVTAGDEVTVALQL